MENEFGDPHIFIIVNQKDINTTLLAALPGIPVNAGLLGFLVFDFKEKFVNSSVELVNSCPWRFCCCDELGSVEKGWV